MIEEGSCSCVAVRPLRTLVLLDGMRIFQPFHVVGFYSAFPADIIATTDVYAGGFNARYGGRISSVIDIKTRNGSKERVTGSASVAPFVSGLRVEVPILKNEASLIVSARSPSSTESHPRFSAKSSLSDSEIDLPNSMPF